MARKSRGQVIRPSGRQRSWAIRFRAYGERYYLSDEAWTEETARAELAYIVAAVERGHWVPPAPEPEAPPEAVGSPTFEAFASEWFEDLGAEGLSENTLADYGWQLESHLMPFFGRHRLMQITVAEVDRYRQWQVRQERLSPTSINKTIVRLGQILDVAEERELIDRNPVRVNPRRRKLRQREPRRTYLDRADHIAALLDAAAELDSEARVDRKATPRRALLATLAFAGLRIGEALALRWRDVDLSAGHLTVRAAKTDAGVREVELLPALRDELATHKASTARPGTNEFVFATATGRPQTASNVRRRILDRSVKRANERREEAGEPPLPDGLTPHSLRRTFASILSALGRELRVAMDQLGHADPRMTLSVYTRTMQRGQDERDRLRALVEGETIGQTTPVSAQIGANRD